MGLRENRKKCTHFWKVHYWGYTAETKKSNLGGLAEYWIVMGQFKGHMHRISAMSSCLST